MLFMKGPLANAQTLLSFWVVGQSGSRLYGTGKTSKILVWKILKVSMWIGVIVYNECSTYENCKGGVFSSFHISLVENSECTVTLFDVISCPEEQNRATVQVLQAGHRNDAETQGGILHFRPLTSLDLGKYVGCWHILAYQIGPLTWVLHNAS